MLLERMLVMGLIIANNLKKKRKQLGLTQQLMSDLINLERSTYAYYETGKTAPSIETAAKICALFDCKIEDLLNEEIDENLVAEKSTFTLKRKDDSIPTIKVASRLITKITKLSPADRLEVEKLIDELIDKKAKK